MIAYIKGKLTHKSPSSVIVETNGIGYHIEISVNTYSVIQNQEEAQLFTHYFINTEQRPLLYGFATPEEKEMFLHLISVSGVGVNTARVILSAHLPVEIQQAIIGNNIKMLTSIKGIGPKSAQRLVLELKDKMSKTAVGTSNLPLTHNTYTDEALQALSALGISKNQAMRAMRKATQNNPNINSVEQLIKETLKLI